MDDAFTGVGQNCVNLAQQNVHGACSLPPGVGQSLLRFDGTCGAMRVQQLSTVLEA